MGSSSDDVDGGANLRGRWWTTDAAPIDTWLACAFEGGGAKGIAYAGVLQAVLDRRSWFNAVAGASAGAITAALIAAGAHPREFESLTQAALAALSSQFPGRGPKQPGTAPRPTRRSVVTRMREPLKGTIADSQSLRTWLGDELDAHSTRADPKGRPFKNVTFGEMYEATLIELEVVAVDLMRKCHCVFNYKTSPACAVADAVTASASIPFVFPPARGLRHSTPEYAYPIVDGGVWTNFPTFVFDDKAFRTFHQLPEIDADVRIIGFLLDEPNPHAPNPAGEPVHGFVTASTKVLPAELQLNPRSDKAPGPSSTRLGRLTARSSSELYDRFAADPASSVGFPVRRFKRLTPLALSGLEELMQPVIAIVVLVGLGIGLYAGTKAGVEFVMLRTSWREWILWLLLVGLVIAGVAGVMMTAAAIAANLVVHYPMRQMGYLIGRTYVAASGAPYWVGRDGTNGQPVDNVIRIPIVEHLKTLTFSPSEAVLTQQLKDAYDVTFERLDTILRRGTHPPAG